MCKKVILFLGVLIIYMVINNFYEILKYDLLSINLCIFGGVLLFVEVKENFENLIGCILVEGYGLMEFLLVVSVNFLDDSCWVGLIGWLVLGIEV